MNGKVYVIGGTNECSRTLDSVEVLDLELGSVEWAESKPMLNGSIYVVGGWDGQGGDERGEELAWVEEQLVGGGGGC